MQGKGFEPLFTGTTRIDRGGIPPYQSKILYIHIPVNVVV